VRVNTIFADQIPTQVGCVCLGSQLQQCADLMMLEYIRKDYFYQELHRCMTDHERMETIIQVFLVIRHHSLDWASVPKSVPK
jgi:hypothetical protein